jgi:hypothetical protein
MVVVPEAGIQASRRGEGKPRREADSCRWTWWGRDVLAVARDHERPGPEERQTTLADGARGLDAHVHRSTSPTPPTGGGRNVGVPAPLGLDRTRTTRWCRQGWPRDPYGGWEGGAGRERGRTNPGRCRHRTTHGTCGNRHPGGCPAGAPWALVLPGAPSGRIRASVRQTQERAGHGGDRALRLTVPVTVATRRPGEVRRWGPLVSGRREHSSGADIGIGVRAAGKRHQRPCRRQGRCDGSAPGWWRYRASRLAGQGTARPLRARGDARPARPSPCGRCGGRSPGTSAVGG